MAKQFIMVKPKEEVTREDLKQFWEESLRDVKTGKLWCSQPDYLSNNERSVFFLFVSTDVELVRYIADGVFYLYASDTCDLSCLFVSITEEVKPGAVEDFYYLSKEPTLIWKEGVFIA